MSKEIMKDLEQRKAKAEWLLSLKRADGLRESACLYTDLCSWYLEAVEEIERLRKLIEHYHEMSRKLG